MRALAGAWTDAWAPRPLSRLSLRGCCGCFDTAMEDLIGRPCAVPKVARESVAISISGILAAGRRVCGRIHSEQSGGSAWTVITI